MFLEEERLLGRFMSSIFLWIGLVLGLFLVFRFYKFYGVSGLELI